MQTGFAQGMCQISVTEKRKYLRQVTYFNNCHVYSRGTRVLSSIRTEMRSTHVYVLIQGPFRDDPDTVTFEERDFGADVGLSCNVVDYSDS